MESGDAGGKGRLTMTGILLVPSYTSFLKFTKSMLKSINLAVAVSRFLLCSGFASILPI